MAKRVATEKKTGSAEPLIQRIPTNAPAPPNANDTLSISEQDQDRLIGQSGLMKRARERELELKRQQITTAQYVWQAVFLCIPFGFLLGAFDVTVKVQYDEPWDITSLLLRSAKAAPALFPVIYLTNRYKAKRVTQVMMVMMSILVGSFLLYTLKHSPSLGQMLRAPGLSTVWVYFIVQLDLLPAVTSLLLVACYWYFGLADTSK
ncbi:hypothetical protein DM01DRAFT_329883 [Hesseltinella vesiculosa]|uniref:DUF7719 domain-containing protein n=1 Tax=Hesseltinella vesiculosa TaxID=101127 RepID=A0A1X2GKV5_9FUNG|nr:hypothetical protein DM01DRAFT_329883 [Hesseltinella vesiculosa]